MKRGCWHYEVKEAFGGGKKAAATKILAAEKKPNGAVRTPQKK